MDIFQRLQKEAIQTSINNVLQEGIRITKDNPDISGEALMLKLIQIVKPNEKAA